MSMMIKYKRIILYVAFGVATTFVNIFMYYICMNMIHFSNILSNIIAWFFAVLFAYLTNRKWVFDSNVEDHIGIVREVFSFFFCRVLTGAIDLMIMNLLVDCMHFPNMGVKLLANLIVILTNYVASRLFIFKPGFSET